MLLSHHLPFNYLLAMLTKILYKKLAIYALDASLIIFLQAVFLIHSVFVMHNGLHGFVRYDLYTFCDIHFVVNLFGLWQTGGLVVILPNINFLYTFILMSHPCDFNFRFSNHRSILGLINVPIYSVTDVSSIFLIESRKNTLKHSECWLFLYDLVTFLQIILCLQ